eukprot:1149495-Pelagomonas_calceolata.AAC.2
MLCQNHQFKRGSCISHAAWQLTTQGLHNAGHAWKSCANMQYKLYNPILLFFSLQQRHPCIPLAHETHTRTPRELLCMCGLAHSGANMAQSLPAPPD